MLLESIFTNFWSNLLVLIVFMIFVVKVIYEQVLASKIKLKISFNKVILMVLLAVSFIVGIVGITLILLPLRNMVDSITFVLLKIVLYLLFAYVFNKLLKFIRVKESK